jgi:hypothetical protein
MIWAIYLAIYRHVVPIYLMHNASVDKISEWT